jgi:hypothetical protein
LAALTLGSVLSIALRGFVPLRPMAFAPGFYDAGLFERSAVALERHNWLGEFDSVTLSKGPAYPLFIAATHRLGIPLQVGSQVLYLMGAASFALAVWLVLHRLLPATFAYLLLAFDPANYGAEAAVVMRDNLYAALSLLFLSSLFVTVLSAVRRTRVIWVLLAAVTTGVSGAAFWLCREEGSWIVPAALVVAIGLPLASLRWRVGPDSPVPLRAWVRVSRAAVALVVVIAAFVAPVALVGMKNESAYGVNLTNDISGGTFPQAYGAWSRVRGVPLTDFVPINRAQREVVYAVSAAARELEPSMEDPANVWNQQGCSTLGVCGDYAGGWELWALRDAAARAGHFGDESDFQAFFGTLAQQINDACNSAQLDCAPQLTPAMQPLLRASLAPTVRSAVHWLGQLPANDFYDTLVQPRLLFTMPDTERAVLQQGIIGVADTDAQELAQVVERASWQWVYAGLATLFRVLFVLLLAASMVGLVLGIFWRKDRPRSVPLWILSGSFAIALATRLLMFAVLDTTQYLVDPRYHYASRTFLLALVAIGTINLYDVVVSHVRVRRQLRGRAGPADSSDTAPAAASIG